MQSNRIPAEGQLMCKADFGGCPLRRKTGGARGKRESVPCPKSDRRERLVKERGYREFGSRAVQNVNSNGSHFSIGDNRKWEAYSCTEYLIPI
jgi:hypothetical protein